MGYCASADGQIVVRGTVEDFETVSKELIESECFEEVDQYDEHGVIEVRTYNDSRYHEEDVYALYEKIQPYIKEADIEWQGEDGVFWKHTFDGTSWKELPGVIVYDEDNACEICSGKETER